MGLRFCLRLRHCFGCALLARVFLATFTRATIATAAAAAATAFAFLPLLHRRTRLTRRLVRTGLTRLPRFARRPCLLLIATLLVEILARALAITVTAIRAFGPRLTRGAIPARWALLTAPLLRTILTTSCAVAITTSAIAVAAATIPAVTTLVALTAPLLLAPRLRTGLGGRL